VFQQFRVPTGSWVDVAVPLSRATGEREELDVHLAVRPGVELAVRRLALEP
jgi:hypothetical protein